MSKWSKLNAVPLCQTELGNAILPQEFGQKKPNALKKNGGFAGPRVFLWPLPKLCQETRSGNKHKLTRRGYNGGREALFKEQKYLVVNLIAYTIGGQKRKLELSLSPSAERPRARVDIRSGGYNISDFFLVGTRSRQCTGGRPLLGRAKRFF